MKQVVVAIILVLGLSVAAAEPAKVAGPWKFTVELQMGTGHPVVTFKQEGAKISGTYEGRYGASPLEGTVTEKTIDFTVTMNAEGVQVAGVFTGTIEGDTMSGTVDFGDAGGGNWQATRAPAKKESLSPLEQKRQDERDGNHGDPEHGIVAHAPLDGVTR